MKQRKIFFLCSYVLSSSENMLDAVPGTLMLTECLDQCRNNDTCSSVNYETGLCVLFSSDADKLPGMVFSSFISSHRQYQFCKSEFQMPFQLTEWEWNRNCRMRLKNFSTCGDFFRRRCWVKWGVVRRVGHREVVLNLRFAGDFKEHVKFLIFFLLRRHSRKLPAITQLTSKELFNQISSYDWFSILFIEHRNLLSRQYEHKGDFGFPYLKFLIVSSFNQFP